MASRRTIINRNLTQSFGLHLRLHRSERVAKVSRIEPNTPAFFSGISSGDNILSINGVPMADISEEQLKEMMSKVVSADIQYNTPTTGAVIDLVDDDDPPPRASYATPLNLMAHQPLRNVVAHYSSSRNSRPSAGRSAPSEVIDLISSDDEDHNERHVVTSNPTQSSSSQSSRQASLPIPAPIPTPSSASVSTTNATNTPAASGTKRSFSATGEDQASLSAKKRRASGVVIKEEFPPKGFGEADVGDEVVEVATEDRMAEIVALNAGQASHGDGGDDEIEFIGGNLTVAAEMPHQREACTRFPFQVFHSAGPSVPIHNSKNRSHCPNCYCYVCEVKAADCTDWTTHCNATYRVKAWKDLQRANNAPVLRLMTPGQKALYLSQYKTTFMNFFAEGDDDDFDSEYDTDHYESDDYDEYIGYHYRGYDHQRAQNRDYYNSVHNVVSKIKTWLKESENDANKFMALLPVILKVMEQTRHAFRKYIECVVIECMTHPQCTSDALEVIRSTASTRDMDGVTNQVAYMQGFLRSPNSVPAVQQLANLPWESRLNLLQKMFKNMNGAAQTALINMFVGFNQLWRVLLVLASQCHDLTEEQVSNLKGVLYTLCKKNDFVVGMKDPDGSKVQYSISNDFSLPVLLKFTAVLMDLLYSSSAALPVNLVALMLFHAYNLSAYDQDANNLMLTAASEENVNSLRNIQTDVLCYVQTQLQANANPLVLSLGMIWLYVTREYSAFPLQELLAALVPWDQLKICHDIALFLWESHKVQNDMSNNILDVACSVATRVMACVDYHALSPLPEAMITEVNRLPRIAISNDPSLQKYHIFLKEIDNTSLSQAQPDLVLMHENRSKLLEGLLELTNNNVLMKRVFGHHVSYLQFSKVYNKFVTAIRGPSSNEMKAELLKRIDTVKLLWKSLVMIMYQMQVKVYGVSQYMITLNFSSVSDDVLAMVSDKEFIAEHGIEAMCLLQTCHSLLICKVQSRAYAKIGAMKTLVQSITQALKTAEFSPLALSYVFLLDPLSKIESLGLLVTDLYRDVFNAFINTSFVDLKVNHPAEYFLLCLAREEWSEVKVDAFQGSLTNFCKTMGEIKARDLGWSKELEENNIQRLVNLIEPMAKVAPKDILRIADSMLLTFNKSHNLAHEVYKKFSLEFTLAHADFTTPILASRLITLQNEYNHDRHQLQRIQKKIDLILDNLPASSTYFQINCEACLNVCSYLGRLDICINRYGFNYNNLTTRNTEQSFQRVLSNMICFCPSSLLEKLVMQLMPMFKKLSYFLPEYITHIEKSLQQIKVPSRHDRYRRELLFYHHRNSKTLQDLLRAVNNDQEAIAQIYEHLQKTQAYNWVENLKLYYLLLGNDGFADHLYQWKVADLSFFELQNMSTFGAARFVKEIYTATIQIMPNLPAKGKALVFLAGLLYMDKSDLVEQCDVSAILPQWIESVQGNENSSSTPDSASQGNNQEVNSRVQFSAILIKLLKQPEKAVEYIGMLRKDAALYDSYKERICKRFSSPKNVEQSVQFNYYVQEYKAMFAFMESFLFKSTLTYVEFKEGENVIVKAMQALIGILNADIFLNKHNIPLNLMSNDSFLRLLFNFLSSIAGLYCNEIDELYSKNIHPVLVSLIGKVKEVAGGIRFVEDYLTCAITTQLQSFTASMFKTLPSETMTQLLSCQPDNAVGNETVTLLCTMIDSLKVYGKSINCHLKLVSVLLRLKKSNQLQYMQSAGEYTGEQFKELIYSILMSPSHMFAQARMIMPYPLGIRTYNDDVSTPKKLVEILNEHGAEGAEALELPIVAALCGWEPSNIQELNNVNNITSLPEFSAAVTQKMPMIFNPQWLQVCAKMRSLSPKFHYLQPLGDLYNSGTKKIEACLEQLEAVRAQSESVYPLFKGIVKLLMLKHGELIANRDANAAEAVAFVSLVVKMYKGNAQGKEQVFISTELDMMVKHRTLMPSIVLNYAIEQLNALPFQDICAIPELLRQCTSELAGQSDFIRNSRGGVWNLWRFLLAHAGPHRSAAINAIICSITDLAMRIRSISMHANNRNHLLETLAKYKELFRPYRGEYNGRIAEEVKAACKIIKSKAKVVSDLQTLLQT